MSSSLFLYSCRVSFSIGQLCPASSLNGIHVNNLLPYPEVYFNIDGTSDVTNALKETLNIASSINPTYTNDKQSYNCTDYYYPIFGHDRKKDPKSTNFNSIIIQKCISEGCPVKDRFVQHAIKTSSYWTSHQDVFCDLVVASSNNINRNDKNDNKGSKDHPYKVNIIVLGGSMTYGSGTEHACCCVDVLDQRCPSINTCKRYDNSPGSSDFYCGWVGFFFRWIEAAYPHISFNLINIASTGTNSELMSDAFSDRLDAASKGRGGINITMDDIVIIDHSMNDRLLPLFTLKIKFELLIRGIISYSHFYIPKILIIEQYTPNYNAYHIAYREVARHYELPIWSFRDVVISEHPKDSGNFFNLMRKYHNHPPWHVHMFIADIFADILTSTTKNCSLSAIKDGIYSKPRTKIDIPPPLFNLTALHHTFCDANKPYILKAIPNPHINDSDLNISSSSSSRLGSRPINVSNYINEDMPGWHEMIDSNGHGKPGFIITSNPLLSNTDDRRILRFLLSPSLKGGEYLKIVYLKTYIDAGYAEISACGKRFGEFISIDALFKDYKTNKISIPFMFSTKLLFTREIVDYCNTLDVQERFLDINYRTLNDQNTSEVRGNQKLKIFSVDVCEVATGST